MFSVWTHYSKGFQQCVHIGGLKLDIAICLQSLRIVKSLSRAVLSSLWLLSGDCQLLSKGQRDPFWVTKKAMLFCREKLGPNLERQVGGEWFWTAFGNRL